MTKLKIGFISGGIVCDLGTDSDMQLFFDCISDYILPKYPDLNGQLSRTVYIVDI